MDLAARPGGDEDRAGVPFRRNTGLRAD